MPESLLTILKFCFLALLYLFFFRVLRAVWAEIRPSAASAAQHTPATPRAQARQQKARDRRGSRTRTGPPTKLTVVEPKEQAGRAYSLADELTVGRAAGCQVALESDSYVSQLHARVFTRDGQLYVEDLGSTNGTYLNRKKVSAPMLVRRGDRLQIGKTVLEAGR
jgi:pSer/pThr/pTyr-binding forkhead associated (FHA) protein